MAKAKPKKKVRTVPLDGVRCDSCDGVFSKDLTTPHHDPDTGGWTRLCVRCEERSGPREKRPLAKMAWYVLAVDEGKEGKVCREILRKARIGNKEKLFGRCFVPSSKVPWFREDGKRVEVARPTFGGYVVVQCLWCLDVENLVRDVKDTFGFLPFRPPAPVIPANASEDKRAELLASREHWHPVPLEEEEIRGLLEKDKEKRAKGTQVTVPYEVGDSVVVTYENSPFRGLGGKVLGIDRQEAGAMVKVSLTILGRPVPSEFNHWMLRKKED